MSNLVEIPLPQLHQSPQRPSQGQPQPQREPSSKFAGPPGKTGGRLALADAAPRPLTVDAAIWFCVGILAAGALAITPLYLHNIVQDAKVEGVERFADGLQRLNNATARRIWALEAAIHTAAEVDPASASDDPLGCNSPDSSIDLAGSVAAFDPGNAEAHPQTVRP